MNKGWLLTPLVLILAGCQSTQTADKGPVKTGYFIDAPVTGLYYQTSSDIKGTTNKGAYQYNEGDVVTFYLGQDDSAMAIASLSGQELITPTLAAATPGRSVNMTRLLLSLDTTPDNREEILLATKALSDPEFQKRLKKVNLEYLDSHQSDLNIELVSVKDAAKHLNESQNYIKENFTSKKIIFEPLNKVLVDDVVSRRDWQGNLCFYDLARRNEEGYYGPVGSLKYKLTMTGIYTYPSVGDYFGSNDGSVASCNLNASNTYTEIEFEEVPDYEEWGGVLACAKTGCTRNDLNGFSIEDFDDEGDWKYRTVAMNYDEKTGLILQKTQGLGSKDTVPHLNRSEYLWLSSENPKLRNIDTSGIWQLTDYSDLEAEGTTCLLVEGNNVFKVDSHSAICPTARSSYKAEVTEQFGDMWWLQSETKEIASLAQLNTPVKWYSKAGNPKYTSWEYLPAGENWDKGLLYRFEQQVTTDEKGLQQVNTLKVAELRKVASL